MQIERGAPVQLNPLQQEAVVAGVMQWVLVPTSASFGAMRSARNSNGTISVCGQVESRTPTGTDSGMTPFIGVLMTAAKPQEFIVVEIGITAAQRADANQICLEAGLGL